MPAKAYKYCRPPRHPTDHYTHYDKLMNEQDREMLKIMNDNLDNLLIFAALFSGVNGAFIAITLNLIIPSSADTTNALLHFLIQRIDNTTSIPSSIFPPPSFPGTTRINCYFCASLAFSLVVALGAIIGKQWLLYYDRVGDVDPLQSTRVLRPLGVEHRGRERLRKLRGLRRWHLQAVLEAGLPTMLQIAVLVFFVGLIDFTRSVEPTVGRLTLGIAAAGLGAYVITVAAAVWDVDCPFQTPVTKTVLPFLHLSVVHAPPFALWIIKSIFLLSYYTIRLLIHYLFHSTIVILVERMSGKRPASPARPRIPRLSHTDHLDIKHEIVIDEMYAPSTDDIRVASWILSMSMDPEALRATAASLPYLHVPSAFTTEYLDTTAISRLLFLFQNAGQVYLGSKVPSSEALSDLLLYGEALFHVLLSSFVEETVRSGSLWNRSLPWWTSYLNSLEPVRSVQYNLQGPVAELRNHYNFMENCLRRGGGLGWVPTCDREKAPLCLASILYLHVSLSAPGLEYRLSWFLAEVEAQEPSADGVGRNIHIPPWNIVSMMALAFKIMPDYRSSTMGSEGRVHDIKAIWGAYTDDSEIFPNFASACNVYNEKMDESDRTHNMAGVDQVYKWLIHSMRAVAEDIDMDRVDGSWAQVVQGSIEVAAVGIRRYSNKKPDDESILAVVRDCLGIAAKDPRHVPFGTIAPPWDFVLNKDAPPNIVELILEGIADIAFPTYPWSRAVHNDVINPERMQRLLDLLNNPREPLRLLVLRLICEGIREDTVGMVLQDDVLPLIAGRLMRDPSTREKDVFDAITRLLNNVIRLIRDSQQSMRILACALVEQTTAEPMNISVIAVTLECWNEYYMNLLTQRGEDGKEDVPVSNTEDAHGTSYDPVWFSNAMVNVVSEYLEITSRPSESRDHSALRIASYVGRYCGKLDMSVKRGTVDKLVEPLVLSRLNEAYERWKENRREGNGVRGSEPGTDGAKGDLKQEDPVTLKALHPSTVHTSSSENKAVDFTLDM
ncbi:hypothetical protein FRB99_000980 [Tulasnella sp. 403]|nr:hypothetical protein FRB99_000980 [Tulasnella sp. 403]